MSNTIETYFFLEQEPREKLLEFSRDLNAQFEDSWFFYKSNTRVHNYSLADFVREKDAFSQTRLITGEEAPMGKRIRFLLSTGDPSAQFILLGVDDVLYNKVGNLFLKNFGCSLDNYSRKEPHPSSK
jgi:hypothetical protein